MQLVSALSLCLCVFVVSCIYFSKTSCFYFPLSSTYLLKTRTNTERREKRIAAAPACQALQNCKHTHTQKHTHTDTHRHLDAQSRHVHTLTLWHVHRNVTWRQQQRQRQQHWQRAFFFFLFFVLRHIDKFGLWASGLGHSAEFVSVLHSFARHY